MPTSSQYAKWTKEMHQYLAWRLFQEMYGATEWFGKESGHINQYAKESGKNITEAQGKVVENRVRRLGDEYEEAILEKLKDRHWHEFGGDDDEWDEDGDFDFIRPSVSYKQGDYELWKSAVLKRLTVKLVYDSATSGISERLVDPYASGAPYGEGYCHKRKEVRKFRFDRVIDIQLTGKKFVKPKDWR